MAFGELYTALQMGVVDGGETDNIDLLFEKFHEVTKYVSYTNHMFLAVALIFSKKQFERLPADIRKAVVKAGHASVNAQRQAMESKTTSALKELKRLGLKFFEVDKNLFREKVKAVYRSNAEKVGGMKIIETVKNQ